MYVPILTLWSEVFSYWADSLIEQIFCHWSVLKYLPSVFTLYLLVLFKGRDGCGSSKNETYYWICSKMKCQTSNCIFHIRWSLCCSESISLIVTKKKKRRSQDCNLLCLGSEGDVSTPCCLIGLFMINKFRMNQTRNIPQGLLGDAVILG